MPPAAVVCWFLISAAVLVQANTNQTNKGSSSTGSDGTASWLNSTFDDASDSSQSVGSDPSSVSLPAAPVWRWFVSVSEGNDTNTCGESPDEPCRTIIGCYYHRITMYAPDSAHDAQLLLHSIAPFTAGPTIYPCEDVSIYTRLIIGTYTRQNGRIQTSLDEDAPDTNRISDRVEHFVQRYTREVGPTDVETMRTHPNEASATPPNSCAAARNSSSPTFSASPSLASLHAVTLNCQLNPDGGRAFYIYPEVWFRLVGVTIICGDVSSADPPGLGAAIFSSGPTIFIMEQCTIRNASIPAPVAPTSDGFHGAILLTGISFAVLSDVDFLSNALSTGALDVLNWDRTINDSNSTYGTGRVQPARSFLWLDRCLFSDNTATQNGAGLTYQAQLTSAGVLTNPTRDDFVMAGIILSITHTCFEKNGVLNGLYPTNRGGGLSVTSMYPASFVFVMKSSFVDSNYVLPPLAAGSASELESIDSAGGGVSIKVAGCSIGSVWSFQSSTFSHNYAGHTGGGVSISFQSQVHTTLRIEGNIFESNLAKSAIHTSEGGGVSVHIGPRLNSAACTLVTKLDSRTGTNFTECSPSSEPQLSSNEYIFDRNSVVSNGANGFGGGLSVFYSSEYRTLDPVAATMSDVIFFDRAVLLPNMSLSVLPSSLNPALGSRDEGEGVDANYSSDRLSIANSIFRANAVFVNSTQFQTDIVGIGGAAFIKLDEDTEMRLEYDFIQEQLHFLSYAFRTRVSMANSTFFSNSASTNSSALSSAARTWFDYSSGVTLLVDAGSLSCENCLGGAVFLQHGVYSVSNCLFLENTASSFGGAIYLDRDSTRLLDERSYFAKNTATIGGQVIYSLSSASHRFEGTVMELCVDEGVSASALQSSLSESASAASSMTTKIIPQISSPVGGQLYFISDTLLVCPSGYSLRNDSNSAYRSSSILKDSTRNSFLGQLLATRIYSCEPCPPTTFSFGRGFMVDDQFVPAHSNVACQVCPFGGDCTQGRSRIRSKQATWTSLSPSDPASSYQEVLDSLVPTYSSSSSDWVSFAAVRRDALHQSASSPDPVMSLTRSADCDTKSLQSASSSMQACPAIGRTAAKFYSCADNFCCPNGALCQLQYCSGHRRGVLCGDCLEGYTFVLASTECRSKSQCATDRAAFWSLLVTFSFVGACTMVVLMARSILIKAHLLGSISLKTSLRSSAAVGFDTQTLPIGGIVRTLVLFMQLFGLALPGSGVLSVHVGVRWLTSLATLQLPEGTSQQSSDSSEIDANDPNSSVYGRGICVQDDMTGWEKVAYNYLFSSSLIIWMIVLYLLFAMRPGWFRGIFTLSCLNCVLRPKSSPVKEVEPPALAGANPTGIELQMRVSAHNSVTSDAESDASQTGARVQEQGISASQDFCPCHFSPSSSSSSFNAVHLPPVSCIFTGVGIDLLLTCYTPFLNTTASFVQCIHVEGVSRLYRVGSVECYTSAQGFALFVMAILSLTPILLWWLPRRLRCVAIRIRLHLPYRAGFQDYECALLVRRLLFVLLCTFLVELQFARSFCLFLVALSCAFFHQASQPYTHTILNQLETITLASLACLCALAIRGATLEDARILLSDSSNLAANDATDAIILCLMIGPFIWAIILAVRQARRKRLMQQRHSTEAQLSQAPEEQNGQSL